MKIYSELMKNDQIKRNVLIKFGFGNVNKSKVEKWLKETYPVEYYKTKKNMKSTNVLEFAPNDTEIMTAEERSAILGRVCVEKEIYSQSFNIEGNVGKTMTNTIKPYTIQFKTTIIEGDILHHMVFEADIRCAEDLLALSLTEGSYTKFKRKSDKRWYTFRALAKRLFQDWISDKVYELNVSLPIEEFETPINEANKKPSQEILMPK